MPRKQIYYNQVQGEGIMDWFHALWGQRKNLKPSARKLMKEYGNIPITSLSVGRSEITGWKGELVNILNSFVGHEPINDKLFHLYTVCHLSNGKNILFEKNQELNMKLMGNTIFDEAISLPVNQQLTMSQMLANAIKKYGENRIFIYDAYSNNCQRFTMDILTASNIQLSQNDIDFILQDVSHLTNKSGKFITGLATSLMNRINIVKEGYGMQPNNGGMTWQLTPQEQRWYAEDTQNNRNIKNMGSYSIWDKEEAYKYRNKPYKGGYRSKYL